MKEMTPDRWALVMQWFERVSATEGSARAALLAEATRLDPSLRQELEALLNADEAADEFLEQPAAEMLTQHLPSESLPSRIGQRIGPYQLQHVIGRGGMGIVYKAERVDGAYQQTVALKLVRHGFESAEVHDRFYRERQILARLEHPNIARLRDGGTTQDGRPWLAMEYIEGEPLHEFCTRRQLGIESRLRLFRDVCAAVQYSHQNFILHRDLKPSNILVTKDGVPKLLDFGIARLLAPDPLTPNVKLTTMQNPQTPAYASPEQVNKLPLNVTSDVYSLGVVLYELLTGARPMTSFSQENPTLPEKPSVAVRTTSDATIPEAVRASLSRILRGDLDTIVLKALRYEPERRYASVEQFSDDIQRYLDRLPVHARKGNLAYRAVKYSKRHRAALATASLVFVSLCFGLALTTWQARVARGAQRQAEAERTKAEQQRLRAEAALARVEAEKQQTAAALARVEEERSKAERQRRLAEQATALARTQQRRTAQEQQRTIVALAAAQRERERAENEKARAEIRSRDVRKLANAMIFEVHNAILAVPGATKARSLLTGFAKDNLNSLAQEMPSDPTLQNELAVAFERLGDVQGNSLHGELGDKKGALASYQQALAIRDKLLQRVGGKPEDFHTLALTYRRLGEVLELLGQPTEAIAQHQRALTELAKLRAADPRNLRLWRDVVFEQMELGNLYRKAGKTEASQTYNREARDSLASMLAAQEAGEMATDSISYNDHHRYGSLLRAAGDLAGALKQFRQSLRLAQARVKDMPGHVLAQRGLGGVYTSLGRTLAEQNDFRGAIEQYQEALKIHERLARQDPVNQQAQQRLRQNHTFLAIAYLKLGQPTEGIEHRRREIEIDEAIAAQSPAPNLRLLANRHKEVADLLKNEARVTEALQHYQRALQLAKQTENEAPSNLQAQRSVGVYLAYVGECQLKLGNTKVAQETLSQMLRRREDLWKAERNNPALQSDLAYAYCLWGDLSAQLAAKAEATERLNYWREARSWYQRGVDLFLDLRQRGQLSSGPTAKAAAIQKEVIKCDAMIAQLQSQTAAASQR